MWRQAVVPGEDLDGLKRARLLLFEPLHDVELRQLGGIDSLGMRAENGEDRRALGVPLKRNAQG